MAEEPAQDNMLQDAVNAVRDGDKTRAKAILTRLLQADQNNALYWVWMSATVDNNKERIYCLQTALKLDPESSSAKRGLILLGAMPPDENVQPFPLNRPRAWEEKLLLAHEQARPKGASNPYVRLALIVIGVVVVLGFAVSSLLAPRQTVSIFRVFPTNTFGVSPTFTLTPTFVNATGQPISTSHGPTPLAAVFGVSYTATPLYVNTPRAPQSLDQYNAALAAYKQGDWTSFIASMQQIEVLEPNAADVPYYIGEAYRLQGDYNDALAAYSQSLHVDPNFAPAYLGSARADLLRDPNANVTKLFAETIADNPNFVHAYLD